MATATARPRLARIVNLYPCPTCNAEGIHWANVYPVNASESKFYCPTCKNLYTHDEVQ